MKINTWSALVSFLFTLFLFIIGLQIVSGQLQASEIVTSLILLLPFFVITFAIIYLLVSHILNKLQDHKYISPYLINDLPKKRETEIKYSLPMVYRCFGILLIVSPILLYYLDHPVLMLMIIFFLGRYYLKTPYRIEKESDTYTIHLLLGQKKIQSDDVHAVKLGVFHNRVDFAEDFIYLNHFLTNVSSLTSKFAQTTGTQNFDQSRLDTIPKNNDSSTFWIYRAIILLLFSILSSVLGVLYLIKYVKQMQ